jgi:hypothetical protein
MFRLVGHLQKDTFLPTWMETTSHYCHVHVMIICKAFFPKFTDMQCYLKLTKCWLLNIWVKITCMYVCMYVYSREGSHSALASRPSLIYCAFPLISPFLIPHFEWSAGLYLWGRHRSHRVPRKTAPGGEILDKLKPHSHIGRVWLIHLLLGTSHKWDHSSVQSWKGVLLDSSDLWVDPLSILVGPCSTLTGPLFFWQKVLL